MVCGTISRGPMWAAFLTAALTAPPLASADNPIPPGKKQVMEFKGGVFLGTVKSLATDGFDLDGTAGQPIAPLEIKARWSFKLSTALEEGGFVKWFGADKCYRLKDLKVGDQVHIEFDRTGDVKTCKSICIIKRPGGRVPPSPNEKIDGENAEVLGYRYHEWRNDYNDWIDKGIPRPAKYLLPQVPPVSPVVLPDFPPRDP